MARVLIAEDEPRVALFIEKDLSANDLAVTSCGREQRFRPLVQVAKRVAEFTAVETRCGGECRRRRRSGPEPCQTHSLELEAPMSRPVKSEAMTTACTTYEGLTALNSSEPIQPHRRLADRKLWVGSANLVEAK